MIHVLGFSINVLTMLALILVIGIVIDDDDRAVRPAGGPREKLRHQFALATVVDYVRANTGPDDWVAVFPEERLVNFLAERRHPVGRRRLERRDHLERA